MTRNNAGAGQLGDVARSHFSVFGMPTTPASYARPRQHPNNAPESTAVSTNVLGKVRMENIRTVPRREER